MKNGPILLVDDDADDRELIAEILQQTVSNEIISFSNGKDAFGFLCKLTSADIQPFLILCDINMPVMTGLDLRQQIHDNEALRKKSIPFVFLTTSASTTSVNKAYELSVQGFFVKDFDIRKMKNMLQQICGYWLDCCHPNN